MSQLINNVSKPNVIALITARETYEPITHIYTFGTYNAIEIAINPLPYLPLVSLSSPKSQLLLFTSPMADSPQIYYLPTGCNCVNTTSYTKSAIEAACLEPSLSHLGSRLSGKINTCMLTTTTNTLISCTRRCRTCNSLSRRAAHMMICNYILLLRELGRCVKRLR